MTRRLTIADYNALRDRGLLANATVRGGNAPDEPQKKSWSNAKPNTIGGVRFPSKVQARVYLRLCELFGRESLRLDVRMPLLAGVKENGRVLYQTIDFCVVRDGKAVLWVDAKTARKSREWERGMALWRATWPEVLMWDGIGDFPGGAV